MSSTKQRVSAKYLDKSASQPVYQQVASMLKAEIAGENWPPGHKIPSEPELARRLNLSVLTVRHAIGQLVDEGLLARERGRGTFVVGLDWNQLSFSLSAATSLLRQKKHLKIKFLTIRMTKLEAGLAEAMELAPGSKVIAISRMLLVSGQPYWLQHSFLHPVPTLPVVESDLTLATVSDFFAPGHSLRLKKARAALKAELPNAADAAFLGIDQSYPVFKLEYRYFDFTDKPLGCGRLLLPPGHVAFESDLGLWN